MQKFWDVAPPATWGILTLAAVFLLAGFVLLSHTLVRSKACGDAYGGVTARGRLESTVRGGAGCLLAGGALWAIELGASVLLTAALGAGALAAFALELFARTRPNARRGAPD